MRKCADEAWCLEPRSCVPFFGLVVWQINVNNKVVLSMYLLFWFLVNLL